MLPGQLWLLRGRPNSAAAAALRHVPGAYLRRPRSRCASGGVLSDRGSALELSQKLQRMRNKPGAKGADCTALCDVLARKVKSEIATFSAMDVALLAQALAELRQKHTVLLDTLATHVLRGMAVYDAPKLSLIANSFARMGYLQRPMMDAIANHLSQRSNELSALDITVLVYAYGELLYHPQSNLLEVCAERLKECYLEVGASNISNILNSYSRLSECNPAVFHCLSRAVAHTRPETFEAKDISLIMNSYAKCMVRKSQTMHLLGDYLVDRVHELSPRNLCNVVHAFSWLTCYNVPLFHNLVQRVSCEDLSGYKLYELGVLCHNLAKLKSGGPTVYGAMFGELARRPADAWEPKAVAQVLDALRRRAGVVRHDALLELLFYRFFNKLETFPVHPLTQAAWCLVELDALDLAEQLPPHPEPPTPEDAGNTSQGFPSGREAMRRVFERMQELDAKEPLTPTQRGHVQQLIRAYRYRYELDFGLLPPKALGAPERSLFGERGEVVLQSPVRCIHFLGAGTWRKDLIMEMLIIGSGTFRTTADLDFFKAIPFTKCVPALYDDGSIGDEEAKKLKAFTDVGDDESMTRARWTSAKFVRHQLRIVLDNAFNPDAEPEDNKTEEALVVAHDDFFLMIRPALGTMSRTDAMAILKRSAVVVVGNKHVTYRLPSEQAIPADRIRWNKSDIILDSSKPTLQNYKQGGPPPLDYDQHTAWESAWLQEAMRVGDVQRQAERQQADRETREAQMHSIPFVKMEADE
ncbi:unnamed protein product [Durusdinium trenchii]|uniref:RNA-editing substrate-binding complex 6 protein domain-containing protein n=2 Tax=Durusdinium trenchii TaxID=1381693 RepID=A0ABP0NZ64_9DINO